MFLERAPATKERVGGDADQDISQQEPGRGLSRQQGFSNPRLCFQILHYKVAVSNVSFSSAITSLLTW